MEFQSSQITPTESNHLRTLVTGSTEALSGLGCTFSAVHAITLVPAILPIKAFVAGLFAVLARKSRGTIARSIYWGTESVATVANELTVLAVGKNWTTTVARRATPAVLTIAFARPRMTTEISQYVDNQFCGQM